MNFLSCSRLLIVWCILSTCTHSACSFINHGPCVGYLKEKSFHQGFTMSVSQDDITILKQKLLDSVVAASSNGFAMKRNAAQLIINQAAAIEDKAAQEIKFPQDFHKIDGKWKLKFTSNISGVAGLGGPGAVREVFQEINTCENSVKNIVRLQYKSLFGEQETGFVLDHSYRVLSETCPARLEITLKDVIVGSTAGPTDGGIHLPVNKVFAKIGAGSFDVVFVDDQLRISRGNFGEVRIFEKVSAI
mmetsp:Transcript_3635/g.5386  ORF Transcript_3635/g.5386 Transcript_3635/m.5386 type:complete len:246 (-) Transcript_3635:57-794(-)